MTALDDETATLVHAAGVITAGSEELLRAALARAAAVVRAVWIEEVILQSYLFAGFPRALNAAREWRRVSGIAAPRSDEGERYDVADEWRDRGEATCATVYGAMYRQLRHNVRELHPALDAWMVVEGYGKVLSRPALDLERRELCVVAACAAARQDRQLHSHLHGALNAGAAPAKVHAALETVADLLASGDLARYRQLLERVVAKRS